MKETVLSVADGVLGRPSRKTPDWFLEIEERIQPLLDEKTRIYNRHLRENSAATNIALREIKAKLQREIRAMKDKWWNEKAEELQEMADKNDFHDLFQGLKANYGPRSNAVAPVKSADGSQLHSDLEDIKFRWKEHFCNLLNQQGTADPSASHGFRRRQTREDLSVPITEEELDKALKTTRCGKAPGQDSIPADVWRMGGTRLKTGLLELFNACWDTECLPQDFKDAVIVTVYKRKGQRIWESPRHFSVSYRWEDIGQDHSEPNQGYFGRCPR